MDTPDRSVPNHPTGLHAVILAACGIVLSMIRCYAVKDFRSGALLLTPYWVSFYTATYQDGFRRRALVGSIMRLISPMALNVIVVNVLATLVLLGILTLLIRMVRRRVVFTSPWSIILLLSFFASSFLSIYFETAGDLLQIVVLLGCMLAIATATSLPNRNVRWVAAFGLLLLSFLVHEAGIFLLAPLLPFVVERRPRLSTFALFGLALVALLALSLKWSTLPVQPTYPVHYVFGTPSSTDDITPPFAKLLRMEYVRDFGDLHHFADFVSTVVRIVLMIACGLIAFASLLPAARYARFIRIFTIGLAGSLPMWVIAHDWGRFTTYTFTLALILACMGDEVQSAAANETSRFPHLTYTRLAAIVGLLLSPGLFTRITGMEITCMLCTAAVFLLALAEYRCWIHSVPTASTP